jgi:hypothetical protein
MFERKNSTGKLSSLDVVCAVREGRKRLCSSAPRGLVEPLLHSVLLEYPLVTAAPLTKHVISLVYDVWPFTAPRPHGPTTPRPGRTTTYLFVCSRTPPSSPRPVGVLFRSGSRPRNSDDKRIERSPSPSRVFGVFGDFGGGEAGHFVVFQNTYRLGWTRVRWTRAFRLVLLLPAVLLLIVIDYRRYADSLDIACMKRSVERHIDRAPSLRHLELRVII